MIEKISEEKILDLIRKGFFQAFGTEFDRVTFECTPEDIPGWDSLGHTLLVAELESLFAITFDLDEMMEMEDVRAIVNVLRKRMN